MIKVGELPSIKKFKAGKLLLPQNLQPFVINKIIRYTSLNDYFILATHPIKYVKLTSKKSPLFTTQAWKHLIKARNFLTQGGDSPALNIYGQKLPKSLPGMTRNGVYITGRFIKAVIWTRLSTLHIGKWPSKKTKWPLWRSIVTLIKKKQKNSFYPSFEAGNRTAIFRFFIQKNRSGPAFYRFGRDYSIRKRTSSPELQEKKKNYVMHKAGVASVLLT